MQAKYGWENSWLPGEYRIIISSSCMLYFSSRIVVLYIRFTYASHFSVTCYILFVRKWLYVKYIEVCFLVFMR